MGANTEILFQLKIEDLCRAHALDIDKYAELAIYCRSIAKTDSEREYWFQMLVRLDKISNSSVKNADEIHEFRVKTESKQLLATRPTEIPKIKKGAGTEIAIRVIPSVVSQPTVINTTEKPWIIRRVEKFLNLIAKLITWKKRK